MHVAKQKEAWHYPLIPSYLYNMNLHLYANTGNEVKASIVLPYKEAIMNKVRSSKWLGCLL